MRIHTKLALSFAIIVASILLLSSVMIYIFSANYRQQEFYGRLHDRAVNTARLLLHVDEVSLELLKIIDRNTITLPEERIVVYNYLNQVLYDSRDEDTAKFPVELLNRVRLQKEVRFHIGTKEALGTVYLDKYNRFVVIAVANDVYGLRKLKNLRLVLLLVFLGSAIITMIAAYFYAGESLKPISNVVSQVDKISAQNLNMRVQAGSGKDEIAQLAETFNRMLERLEESFELQKHFVSNASHELRTPLTSVTGQIEVALMKDREDSEYKAILRSVLDDIRNMSKLSNGLLDLAQANLDVLQAGLSPARVDELLWQARDELLKINIQNTVHIEYIKFPDDEDALKIRGNAGLIKAAFTNLMDNACKFSPRREVWVKINCLPGSIEVDFIDKGYGIDSEDIQKIFEPFYRSQHTKHIKGHGLGLALTRKIILLHGGNIDVQSEKNIGTTMTVSLPVYQQETVA